jgi:hypothetical protein
MQMSEAEAFQLLALPDFVRLTLLSCGLDMAVALPVGGLRALIVLVQTTGLQVCRESR